MVKTLVTSLEQTSKLAKKILDSLEQVDNFATVIFLKGDLGSGKTTFTKALAEHMGVSDTVISPTFILQKKYAVKHKLFDNLFHIDAYRFEDPKEAKVLLLAQTVSNPRNLVVIEWPEKLGRFAKASKKISFKTIDENTKQIVC